MWIKLYKNKWREEENVNEINKKIVYNIQHDLYFIYLIWNTTSLYKTEYLWSYVHW